MCKVHSTNPNPPPLPPGLSLSLYKTGLASGAEGAHHRPRADVHLCRRFGQETSPKGGGEGGDDAAVRVMLLMLVSDYPANGCQGK